MLIIKIIVFIILFLLPAVQLIRDWKFHDKRTRLYRRITYTVLIAYFALIIPSAFLLYFDIGEASRTQQEMQLSQESLVRRADEQAEAQRQLRDKSDQIAALYQTIAQAQSEIAQSQRELRTKAEEQADSQRQLRKKSDEIAVLNNLLAAKSDEIANLNREIAASVTGGDSYCYFAIEYPFGSELFPEDIDLLLVREGKYPLYDINIEILDLETLYDDLRQRLKRQLLLYVYTQDWPVTRINVGNIGVQQSDSFMGNIGIQPSISPKGAHRGLRPIRVKLPDSGVQLYLIQITARNGYVNQFVKFKRVNGKWKKAVKVIFNGKEVKEIVDLDFPRNDKGQVEWHQDSY